MLNDNPSFAVFCKKNSLGFTGNGIRSEINRPQSVQNALQMLEFLGVMQFCLFGLFQCQFWQDDAKLESICLV